MWTRIPTAVANYCQYVSLESINRCGFSDKETARASFYKRAKVCQNCTQFGELSVLIVYPFAAIIRSQSRKLSSQQGSRCGPPVASGLPRRPSDRQSMARIRNTEHRDPWATAGIVRWRPPGLDEEAAMVVHSPSR